MRIDNLFEARNLAVRENQIRTALNGWKKFHRRTFDNVVSKLAELFVVVITECEEDAFERGQHAVSNS